MIIKHGQLTLLQHIGQGNIKLSFDHDIIYHILGEFGIVYKATLKERFGNTSVVAVKTLKGKGNFFDRSILHNTLCYVI